tara:strand:- start:595 stop:1680 length:1086 start_codon:yes stop_codon:yes gene_type:complete
MPQYGSLKIDSFLYNNSGSDVTLNLIDIAPKASPTFTGNLTINAQGDLRLADADSSNYVGFQAPATVSSNLIWTLPAADGGANQVLKTDGSGNLGWTTDVALTLVDEDNMASNSATSVPSQQSVKAYADLKAPLASPTFTGDVTFTGASYNVVFDTSANRLHFADNALAEWGAGTDLAVIHDGTNSYVTSATGDLQVKSDSFKLLSATGSENIFQGVVNGAATMYYDNNAKIATASTGVNITGTAEVDGITIDGAYEQVAEAVGALAIDCSTGNYFTKTISANSTFTFTNPAPSGSVTSFTLELTHSSGTITWPTTVVWNGGVGKTAPTVTAGKTHLFMFVTDDAGTTYRGAVLPDYDNAA